MSRRKLQERDLRSLDRPGLQSIFSPLDPNARPARREAKRYLAGQMFTSAFTREEPRWRDGIGLLFLPILAVLISVLLWVGVPQLIAWLVVLAYLVAFSAAALVVYRKA